MNNVRNFLLTVDLFETRRGRRLGHGGILKQMRWIVNNFATSDEKLHLLRTYTRLEEQLAFSRVGWKQMENAFIREAAAYGERKGIGYDDWRRLGVRTAVLRKAGITKG